MRNQKVRIADLQRQVLQKSEIENSAEAYIRLLMLARLTLRYLDQLEGSLFQKNKLKMHTKGFLKELEFLDTDIADVWSSQCKQNKVDHMYLAMEGQRMAINWIANCTLSELIAIAKADGIKINWEEEKVRSLQEVNE